MTLMLLKTDLYMKWSAFFTSSVGKKFVMAITGLFLISFLVVHVGVNACMWADDNGSMFNRAAHFLGSTVVIRIKPSRKTQLGTVGKLALR